MKSYMASIGMGLLIALHGVGASAEEAEYAIDRNHTSLLFSVDHAGWARVYGRFREVSGTLRYDPDELAASSVEVSIDAASLDTNQSKRDEHLRSPDFFNVQEFPDIHFRSTAVKPTGPHTARVEGQLTMLGVTRAFAFDAKVNARKQDEMTKQMKAGFSLRGTLDRSEFGMKYAIPRVSDAVEFLFEIETIQQ